MTDQPVNVWYSDGVRYEDYRQDDGRIITVRVGDKTGVNKSEGQ